MYSSLVYYPDVGVDSVGRLRRKYDPTFELIRPHVTIVFPVPESVGERRLLEHERAIVHRSRGFAVRFRGFVKSPDHWLFFKVDDGKPDFVQLYESMYTGPLAPFRRVDVEFVPHISLGLFVKKDARYDMSAAPQAADLDEASYRKVLDEAEAEEIDLRCSVSRLDLVELEEGVLLWARGKSRELPSAVRARTTAQFDLVGDVDSRDRL